MIEPSAIVSWDIDEQLLRSPAIVNRNLLAEKYAARPAADIITQYAGLAPEQLTIEFTEVFDAVRDLGIELQGAGIELGAGVGVFSAVAVRYWHRIDKVLAVEIVPKVTELLQPRATQHMAPDRRERIVGVIGSFDDIKVADRHFDFCIEYASLHHSNDLKRTLREVARVLKPGATLVAVDRSHRNGVSEAQLDFMLNVQYPAAWKEKNGYPDVPLTRAQNGEHEIRLREWMAAFAETGFELIRRVELRSVGAKEFWYKARLMLPFSLRRMLDVFPSRVGPTWLEMFWRVAMLFGWSPGKTFRRAEKEHTVFILRRRW